MKCPGCIIYVAQTEHKRIGGYIACAAKKNVLEIVSLAVGMNSRRRGLAQQLLKAGLCYGKLSKCFKSTLHVSLVNFPAQKLYTSFGYASVGWLNEYYKDENEGALLMEYLYI
jgi:ribosomal-protein-alanine N-acetyltransferase